MLDLLELQVFVRCLTALLGAKLDSSGVSLLFLPWVLGALSGLQIKCFYPLTLSPQFSATILNKKFKKAILS